MSMCRLVALAMVLASTGCLDDATRCADGTLCPAGNVCHAGTCAQADLVDACAGLADDAACELRDVGAGTCRDGLCLVPVCGNGRQDVGEVCDDGNLVSGDGCRGDCQSLEACGNGVLDPDEGCDDGAANGDTPDAPCRTDCTRARCGDGIIDLAAGEACDAGAANTAAPDGGCRPNCQPRRCADGVVDPLAGEVCDDGNLAPGDGYSFDCVSDEACGNGVVDLAVGELCDDGGQLDHDGCDDTCAPAPLAWHLEAGGLGPRTSAAMAFDAARGEAVLFGGAVGFGAVRETWTRRGGDWTRRWPRHAPTARSAAGLAWDPRHGQVVLFGGFNGSGQALQDTWTWDGTDWTLHEVAAPPPARARAAMAFDPVAGEVLMGGGNGGGALHDVWAWDGTTWQARTALDGDLMYLATEPRTGAVVALGSRGLNVGASWRRDGDGWIDIDGPQPPVRFGGNLVAAPMRDTLLLLGGTELHLIGDPPGDPNATWELTAAGWQVVTFTPTLPLHSEAAVAVDGWRDRVVLTAGSTDVGAVASTWEFDGSGWQLVDDGVAEAPPDGMRPAVYDARRGEVLAFSQRDLWRWAGGTWTPVVHPSHPPQRADVALAYDAGRDELILFGGYSTTGGGRLGDTWRWNGSSWSQLPVAGPSPRSAAQMAYDPARGEVILFGGYDPAIGRRNDTWRWDGSAWTQLTPAHAPAARDDAGLAADPRAGTLVLFGGINAATGQSYGDTWLWDGVDWIDATPAAGPAGRTSNALASDPWRGGVVMFGDDYATDEQLWWWDGAAWTASVFDVVPAARADAVLVPDAARHGWLLAGGYGGFGVGSLHDTWTLAAPAGAAEEACRDQGDLDLDGDGLAGCADPECWWACAPGCGPAATAASTCDPASTSPACGDGVCDAIEGCRGCAADCGACVERCGDGFCDGGESAASCVADCAP